MIFVPTGADFRWQVASATGQPTAAFGATVTPAQNSKGSWTQLISGGSVVNEVWAIAINVNSGFVNAEARSSLADIGIDPAGGTSYTVVIADLLCGSSVTYISAGSGIWFYFPLYIPAGSSIAMRGSVNNATVGSWNAHVVLYGLPRNPETTRRGTYVESVGANTSLSRGTIITDGTTSEGAWQSLGTVSRSPWWWQIALNQDSASMGARLFQCDLSGGTTGGDRLLIENFLVNTATNESVTSPMVTVGAISRLAAGSTIFGRAQGSSPSPGTNVNMMAYGLGGSA